MLYIVIESFILSLMLFKLNQLENCGFVQLSWLLGTVRVHTVHAVISLGLSGLQEGLC